MTDSSANTKPKLVWEHNKETYYRLLDKGLDPNSLVMQSLRQSFESAEREQRLDKLAKEEPERYQFLMSGVNINE